MSDNKNIKMTLPNGGVYVLPPESDSDYPFFYRKYLIQVEYEIQKVRMT